MERFRRNGLESAGNPVFLDAQGKETEGVILRSCQNAVDEFLLEHHDGPFHGTGPGKKVLQNGPSGGIRQVAQKFDRSFRKESAGVPGSAVRVVHLHMGISGPTVFLVFRQAGVKFHQDHPAAERCGVFGQGPGSRPHFHDTVLRLDFQLVHNPAGHVFVRQEVLPERFAGAHVVFFQNIPDLNRLHAAMFSKTYIRDQ